MRVQYESVPHADAQSVICRRFVQKQFDCPYHIHREMEIVRIDSSEGRVLAGDYSGTFQPGQIFLFGSNLPHAFLNYPECREARSTCIQFSPQLSSSMTVAFHEAETLTGILGRAGRGVFVGSPAAEETSRLMDRVFSATGLTRIARTLELLDFLSHQEDLQLLASDGYVPALAGRQISRLESVLSHIHKELFEALPIARLAIVAGMSPTAFQRFFRQSMGRTPGAYISDLRFSAVAHRLLETNDPVTEIAFSSGFNNLSNFNRLFKKRFGCSPREYRSRLELPE